MMDDVKKTINVGDHQPSTINHQPSKYTWVKEVPNYIQYFSPDHRLIIELVGIDNYWILHDNFYGTGIYFSTSPNPDQEKIKQLIGEENYIKLFTHFLNSDIYFNGNVQLKKAWVKSHKHVDSKTAARTVGMALTTIYNWRNE